MKSILRIFAACKARCFGARRAAPDHRVYCDPNIPAHWQGAGK